MMLFFHHLTLRNKIITVILTTVLLALSFGFSIGLYQELSSIKNNLLKEKILTAKIVGSYTTSDLIFSNKDTALEALSYLKTDTTIINAHLYDENNVLFVSLYKNRSVHTANSSSSSFEFFENELLVVEPIHLGKQKIGTLHLISSTEQYTNTIQKRIMYFIIIIIILSLMSFALAGKLSSIVTAPILSLINAVNSFSTNNISPVKINSKHDDETRLLINSFNELLAQLKTRENERDKAKEYIANILDNMVEGVMAISSNGTIKSVNQTAEKIFGYNEDELVGQAIITLTTAHQIDKYRGHYNYYFKTNRLSAISKGFETTGVRKDKSEFPVHVTISEIPDSEHDEKLLIISCEDISDFKSQEEQLRRTQRMDSLGKLTGGIAHDYNNMLGVIIGYAELIELENESPGNLKSYISEILHAGERGKSLTNKLLSFTKRDTTEANKIDINTVILQIKNLIEKTITSRIKLELCLDNNIWETWLDVGDLEDAIINLSINAMHAMDNGGVLKIESSNIHMDDIEAAALQLPSGDYIELKIIDTGAGMNDITRAHIFEPFFTTKKDKGTGLGLSQVYGFVKRSNGEVKVYSEINKGTHFNFYFPRYISTQNIETSSLNDDITSNDFRGTETILVVDDEKGLRGLAESLLNIYGYNVLTAENGSQALSILDENNVDLLLSDIVMPGMDGYQLSTKASKLYPNMKIQLASGFTADLQDKLGEGNKELHDNLLHKPYRKNELLQRVRKLLDN